MAWTLNAQLTNSTNLAVNTTDQIWWTAGTDNTSANYVVVGAYQAGTHIYQSDGTTHRCSTNHVNNTQYISSTNVAVNGGGSILLTALTTAQCGLQFIFSTSDLGGASVATSGAKFYAYDGTTDANGMAGITFQAFSPGQGSSTWTAANGSGSALSFTDQTAATTHTYYAATSASPTSTGAKTGKVKLTLTYV